jgi:HSP20 family protein
MLMRFDPFHEFDRLFESVREGRGARTMPLDAYRKGEQFHVDLDLPGMRPDSIEVTVEKNVLTVRAERHWSDEGTETVVCERPQGTFTRQLFLGEGLDAAKVEASYADGVLRLRVPVAEEAKPRRVEVTSASKAEAITTASAA